MAPAEGQGASLLLWVEGAESAHILPFLVQQTKHALSNQSISVLVPRPQTQTHSDVTVTLLRNPESSTNPGSHSQTVFYPWLVSAGSSLHIISQSQEMEPGSHHSELSTTSTDRSHSKRRTWGINAES